MNIAEQLHFRGSILVGDDLAVPDSLAGLALPASAIIFGIPSGVECKDFIIVMVRPAISVDIERKAGVGDISETARSKMLKQAFCVATTTMAG